MKSYELFEKELREKKKTANSPEWNDSDAPDAEGRFKKLGIKALASWLIKTRNKDLKKITGSLNQQIVFNRNDDPPYAQKMEKVRKEVYRQLGRKDLLEDFAAVGVAPEGNVSGMGPAIGPNPGSEGSGDSWSNIGAPYSLAKLKKKKKKIVKTFEDFSHSFDSVVEGDISQEAFTIHSITKSGQDAVQNFIDDNNIDAKKLVAYVQQNMRTNPTLKYDVRDYINGNPGAVGGDLKLRDSFIKKFQLSESTGIIRPLGVYYKNQDKTVVSIAKKIDGVIEQADLKDDLRDRLLDLITDLVDEYFTKSEKTME
jgi:hypothetical protein